MWTRPYDADVYAFLADPLSAYITDLDLRNNPALTVAIIEMIAGSHIGHVQAMPANGPPDVNSVFAHVIIRCDSEFGAGSVQDILLQYALLDGISLGKDQQGEPFWSVPLHQSSGKRQIEFQTK